jgi:hypothetical protein
MDKKTFELKVQQIQQGEFVSDQSIFEYAHDSFYEMKRLFDALRQCCDWQKQKIEILKRFNQGLERSLRKSNSVNERYRAKLIELGVDPDAL